MNVRLAAVVTAFVLTLSRGLVAQSPQLIAPTDPLTPQQQQELFHLPPGFEIQLVVADPTIGQPMNLNFDAAGRLWITSSVTYPFPTSGEGVEPRDERMGPESPPPPRDWVTVVEGIGSEGVPTRVWKFDEGLNIPIGVVPVKNGTIVYDIPAIQLRSDTDGDGRADEAKRLLWGFGNIDTHGMNNSFTRWIDGWIYACHGFRNTSNVEAIDGRKLTMNSGNTYRFREDGTGLEQFTWGQVNPYGLTFDPLGNLYSADCHSLPLTLLLRGAYYPSFGKPHDGLGFGPTMIDHLHGSTGICGPAYYAATQFPEDYRENLYLCNPVTGRVHRDKLVDHGSTRLVDTQPDFITCDDPWFRPVDVKLGPDGCLYLADFYNAIIGHYEVELKHPRRDRELGRVWRVVYRGEDASISPPSMPDLTTLPLEELVTKLGDDNLVLRMLATNEIIDRFGSEATRAVGQVFESDSSPEQRVHAMWVLFRLDALNNAMIQELAEDDSRLVRTHVARMLAESADAASDPEKEGVLRHLIRDEDAFVRRAAVDALGRQPRADAVPLLLALLDQTDPADTHLRHTIRIALRNQLRDGSLSGQQLLSGRSEAHIKELMSVALAVESEGIAGFLAQALGQCEESPSDTLACAKHVARFGKADDIHRALTSICARFEDDLAHRQQTLLSLRAGLEQAGKAPDEFLRREAAATALTMFTSEPASEITWQSLPIAGLNASDKPWKIQQRPCADGQQAEFFSTLPSGERARGIHRSSTFAIPKTLTFFMAGHCGPPDQPCHGKNQVRLLDAETGVVLAEADAPRNDTAQQVDWDLAAHQGRRGYVELIDGDTGRAYAWLAVGRFSLNALNPVQFSPLDGAVELVKVFHLDEMTPQLQQLMSAHSTETFRRRAAAEALVALQPDARLTALVPFASDPQVVPAVRDEIFAAAQTRDPMIVEKSLAAVMQALPAARQDQFAKELAGDRQGGESLLTLIESGKASRLLLLDENLKRQLSAARVDNLDARLAELTRGLPSLDAQIAERIAHERDAFDPAIASAEAGRVVFEKVCAACHRIGDKGALIGPQLDGVGIRGVERLLEDLLDPNRNVDGAFRTTTLLLTDGRVLTGLFRRQEGETLVFADQQGKEFNVQEGDIEERSLSAVSLMPSNLYETVQPEQVDDLLAYLLQQRTQANQK